MRGLTQWTVIFAGACVVLFVSLFLIPTKDAYEMRDKAVFEAGIRDVTKSLDSEWAKEPRMSASQFREVLLRQSDRIKNLHTGRDYCEGAKVAMQGFYEKHRLEVGRQDK